MKGIRVIVSLVLIALSISACGFQYRRTMPAYLDHLYLETANPYSPLTRSVRDDLRNMGVRLTDSPDDAPLTLALLDDYFKETKESLGVDNTTEVFILKYYVRYQLSNRRGKVVLGPDTVTIMRRLRTDTQQRLGSDNERAILKQEMREEALYQLLNQLEAWDVQQILKQQVKVHQKKIKGPIINYKSA